MSALKLCLLSSEIMPYAKTGGLADVAGALIRNLRRTDVEVRAFMPLYPVVKRNYSNLQPVLGLQQLHITLGATRYDYSLHTASFPGTDIPVYFVDCPALFERAGLYTFDADEHRRFILFTRATIECTRRLGFAPQIFHCNDWHTALLPLFLKTVYSSDAILSRARSVLTVHNIGYQGIFPASAVPDLAVGTGWTQLDQDDLGRGVVNSLKTGLRFADRVTTVSPTYAREVVETSLGMGMEGVLRDRGDRVVGILNGVDYRDWDPRHDQHLTTHFDALDLRGKQVNKRQLLTKLRLTGGTEQPLVGMVTRLAEQKGIDLLFDALPAMLDARQFTFVILGNGDQPYEDFFRALAQRYPGRVSFRQGYDEGLAHQIEAGSDLFLMPSRYEPCGLNQMYSLRYGTVPVVRRTGGLADSVQHFDPATGTGTGCVFNDYDVPAVRWALGQALDWFADPAVWQKLMRNGMAKDFSWEQQVEVYERLYRSLLPRGLSQSGIA